jgi:RHS repeat-associated protein
MAASRTTVRFAYDVNGQRTSKTVVAGGTTSVVNDVYQLGHLAYQTDATGATLATFTYDASNVPTSVTVGSGSAAPRFYYVYNGHGDVVNLTDASGTVVASYAYDEFGVLTSSSETLPNGWTNPYRYDGRDGVRSDGETGRSWMAVRADDPSVGRCISRDPLGRAPLFFAEQPYADVGNNPLVNVDPSGQSRRMLDGGDGVTAAPVTHTAHWGQHAHIVPSFPRTDPCNLNCRGLRKQAQLIALWTTALDIASALVAVFQVVRDLIQFLQDWNTVGGLDRVLALVGDGISIAADVVTAIGGLLQIASHWFDVSTYIYWAHVIAAATQGLAAAYKGFRAASGWLMLAAKVAFFTAVIAFKTATSEINLGALVLGIGFALLQRMGLKVDGAIVGDAAIAFGQMLFMGASAKLDKIQSMSGAGICKEYGC